MLALFVFFLSFSFSFLYRFTKKKSDEKKKTAASSFSPCPLLGRNVRAGQKDNAPDVDVKNRSEKPEFNSLIIRKKGIIYLIWDNVCDNVGKIKFFHSSKWDSKVTF